MSSPSRSVGFAWPSPLGRTEAPMSRPRLGGSAASLPIGPPAVAGRAAEEGARAPVPKYGEEGCAVCGRRLTVHQLVRSGTCDDASCKRTHLHRTLAKRRKQNERLVREMLEFRARTLRSLGETDPESFPLAILPFNGQRVVNLPERRKRSLRDRLNRLLSEAAAQAASRGSKPPPARPAPAASPRELAVLASGCATCRGYCCENGKNQAYLEAVHLRRYMAEHPHARPREVLEAYLSRVPNRSYIDSCVYHTARGCALPREMRADTCIRFYCEEIEKLRDGLAEAPTLRCFAVNIAETREARAGIAENQVVRAAIVDERGVHEIPGVGRPAGNRFPAAPRQGTMAVARARTGNP